jgi:magnesium chelatase family protein
MLFKTFRAAVFEIDVDVDGIEVDVTPALSPNFNVVRLPDVALKERRERIRSALRNCGSTFPPATRSRLISPLRTLAIGSPPLIFL